MADFELTTYISNCLLLRIRFNFDKKKDFLYFIYFRFKIFLLNKFLKKLPFSGRGLGLYTDGFIELYTHYKVNVETFSLNLQAETLERF